MDTVHLHHHITNWTSVSKCTDWTK
uniref:Uncharacterized protein n=1 Tax=Arundo donax TaxID=35708 RepID=A0A0A9B4I0_ARUDO